MKKTIILLIAIICVHKPLLLLALPPESIKNSLSEINGKMGKITLELLYTWGDGDEEGHIFKTPSDIAVDSKNRVYIVDSALHCIKVFDSNRRFIRKIGGKGQGPADTLTPSHIGIDSNNIIWVFEYGNGRIQAFSETGTSLAILKVKQRITSNFVFPSSTQVALFDHESATKGEGIIAVIEKTGANTMIIGKQMLMPQIDIPMAGLKYDSCNMSFNRATKKYYVTYNYSQMIQQFKKNGKLEKCIFYDTPINKLKLSWDSKRNNYNIVEKKKFYSECIDSEIDDRGRFFIVVSTRLPKKNEGKSMLLYPNGTIVYLPRSKDYPEKTDMYRLMVFGADGKILAAKQLDVFCDEIYINKDRIFLIDKTFAQVIYEFKYEINQNKGNKN